jgi:hypothetical protein
MRAWAYKSAGKQPGDNDGPQRRPHDRSSNRTCRRLHFAGSTLTLACLAMLIATGKPQYLLYGLLCGYGFAWVGHFGFEKNKPASFKRPLYSFMGDWVMYKDIWTGKVSL